MKDFNYNNIIKNTQVKINEFKRQRPLMKYNKQSKTDEPIKYLNNKPHNWHIIINPMKLDITKEDLKYTFNYIKNRYGKFMYGKDWTNQLNLDFDIAIEKELYNHLHILIRKITINDMAILFNYLADCFDFAYQTNTIPHTTKEKTLNLLEHPKYYAKQLDDSHNQINIRRLMNHPILTHSTAEEIKNSLTPELIPEFNVLTYTSKKSDTLFYTAKDFIK